MLMNLSKTTDVVKGMLNTYCLRTNVDRGDICAQRAHFLMIFAQKCAQNFECVHGTCPVLIDFFPYWMLTYFDINRCAVEYRDTETVLRGELI